MRQVDVDGLSIAYERAGDGPALVLLHGFLFDSRAWRPQLEDLVASARAVWYKLRMAAPDARTLVRVGV